MSGSEYTYLADQRARLLFIEIQVEFSSRMVWIPGGRLSFIRSETSRVRVRNRRKMTYSDDGGRNFAGDPFPRPWIDFVVCFILILGRVSPSPRLSLIKKNHLKHVALMC